MPLHDRVKRLPIELLSPDMTTRVECHAQKWPNLRESRQRELCGEGELHLATRAAPSARHEALNEGGTYCLRTRRGAANIQIKIQQGLMDERGDIIRNWPDRDIGPINRYGIRCRGRFADEKIPSLGITMTQHLRCRSKCVQDGGT